ncbi:MAG: hypothetical protein ABI311_10350 [Gemmatimonadaceae bacterium]
MAGIRTVEIGSVMFGAYNADGSLNPASMELVRLAIPRRVYTQSHIEYDVETFEEVMKHRKEVRGLRITREPRFLRHLPRTSSRLHEVTQLQQFSCQAVGLLAIARNTG